MIETKNRRTALDALNTVLKRRASIARLGVERVKKNNERRPHFLRFILYAAVAVDGWGDVREGEGGFRNWGVRSGRSTITAPYQCMQPQNL